MDNRHNDEQHARASLRGKGREILLGQRQDADAGLPEAQSAQGTAVTGGTPISSASPDPSALTLSPEEADALLNFADDSPVYRPGFEFATAEQSSAWAADQAVWPETAAPDVEESGTSAPTVVSPTRENYDDNAEEGEPDSFMAAEAAPVETLIDLEDTPQEPVAASGPITEGLPIAEGRVESADGFFQAPYEPHEEVEVLTPGAPEEWSEDMLTRGEQSEAVLGEDGGVYVQPTETAASETTASTPIGDPFPPMQRTHSEDLFKNTPVPDKEMLDKLVHDEHIQKLWEQIEALHEELVAAVEGDRSVTDDYQRELLRASGLLLESRENYDDARAIVYRIRADLSRQRRVYADIMRYRPLLLKYYFGWGVALAVLFLLKKPVSDLGEEIGLKVLAALYYPLLLGITGAMISGYLTLDRHTTKQRDFDPMHITWYLFNPLLGGVMGLLMFLLTSIANEDLLQNAASRGEIAITYLLCVIAGMNQTSVLRRLNELMDRFASGSKK